MKIYVKIILLLTFLLKICATYVLNIPQFISKDLAALLYMHLDNKVGYDYITHNIIGLKTNTTLAFGNRVYSSGTINQQDIDKVIKDYNNLSFKWWINENQHNLVEQLKKSGFVYDNSYPLMKLNISKFNMVKNDLIDKIKCINTSDDINTWIKIMSQVDEIPYQDIKTFVDYLLKNSKLDSIKLYLGYLDNTPVGGSVAILHDNFITIHLVGVLSEFRKRGMGSALTIRPLLDFKNKGIEEAYLISTKKGVSVYKNMGFHVYDACHVYVHLHNKQKEICVKNS